MAHCGITTEALDLTAEQREQFISTARRRDGRTVESPVRAELQEALDSTLLTFLIADIQGYTRFTVEHGDEAAARPAEQFASVGKETVAYFGGEVTELRTTGTGSMPETGAMGTHRGDPPPPYGDNRCMVLTDGGGREKQ